MRRQVTVGELTALGGLVAAYGFFLAEPHAPELLRAVNVLGPAALVTILAVAIYRRAASDTRALLCPSIWIRIAIAVYFGFGSIFPSIASKETLEYMRAWFPFDDDMVLRLNLLNAVGTWSILVGIAAIDRWARGNSGNIFSDQTRWLVLSSPVRRGVGASNETWAQRSQVSSRRAEMGGSQWFSAASRRAALLWLAVGLAWRFLVDLPNQFGLFEIIVPGAFGAIGLARLAGYTLLLADPSPAWRRGRTAVFCLWVVDVILGLATFAKTDTILLILVIAIACVIRGVALQKLAVVGLAFVILYGSVRPLVDYGRERMFERYGSLLGAGLMERMMFVGEFLEGRRAQGESEADPWAWVARISYVNAQAFVVDRYDRGDPGDSISVEYIITLLIPRVLWLEKPVVSDVGINLYRLATGQDGTSIAPGVFAEAYWNGGWLLVCCVSFYVGLVIGGFARFGQRVLAEGRVSQFPVVLMAIVLAVRPDGWFGLTYVGGAATVALLALAMTVPERLQKKANLKV